MNSDIHPGPIRRKLGEIFVEQGLLTETAVERMVTLARTKNVRFGTLLEQIGLVTPEELADALAIQYRSRKIRGFARHQFPQELLRMIPLAMAVEHTIFPLKFEDGKLALAVIDPTAENLYREIGDKFSARVVVFVSTRTDINCAIARHYMGREINDSNERTILLIEDDQLVRESVSKILNRRDYVVETAPDAMEAFKKIFTFRPKLIIVDKVMPKLGGYEFLDAVRKIPEFSLTPIILMTANATPEEEKTAFEKGFFDFILKPVKEIGLLTRVQRGFRHIESAFLKAS